MNTDDLTQEEKILFKMLKAQSLWSDSKTINFVKEYRDKCSRIDKAGAEHP